MSEVRGVFPELPFFLQAAWTLRGLVSVSNDSRFEYFNAQMHEQRIASRVIRCEQQTV